MLLGPNRQGIDQVLGQESHLHLLAADDAADQEVVRPVVPCLGRDLGRLSGPLEDELVCLQRPRELHRDLLPPRGGRSTRVISAPSCGPPH